MEAVRITVRYDTPQDFGHKDGPETRREFNMRFGQPPGPEADIPDSVGHVWGWFWQLNRRRQSDQGTPQPVTDGDVAAWMRNRGIDALPEEVEIIFAMDDAYLSETAKEHRAQMNRQKSTNPPPPKKSARR